MPTRTATRDARAPGTGRFLPTRTVVGLLIAASTIFLIAVETQRSMAARRDAATRLRVTLDTLQATRGLTARLNEAEAGQRGFLLLDDESYLDPYHSARAELPVLFDRLTKLTADRTEQRRRVEDLRAYAEQRVELMDRTIAMVRAGQRDAAVTLVRENQGRALMQNIASLGTEIRRATEQDAIRSQDEWEAAVRWSLVVTWSGASLLLLLTGLAGWMMAREHRERERAGWLRAGRAGLGSRLIGQRDVAVLGDTALSYLVGYLGACAGTLHVADDDGSLVRIAGFGIDETRTPARVRRGEGLPGRVAAEGRAMHVRDVPAEHLVVTTSTGTSTPRELLLVPATAGGDLQGVIELGFFRQLRLQDVELMDSIGDALGTAIRAARDRERLSALLAETQRQSDALERQQEELRATNEELERQAEALTASQTRLEEQTSELEETNVQLEEQAAELEAQKTALLQAQGTLEQRASQLARASRYKSEFLANMSHELRTPLNSTLILARLLADNKKGNLDEEQVEFARTILSAGNDLLALINDILDLARIEAGKVDLEPEPVELHAMCEALERAYAPQAAERSLRLSIAVQPGAPRVVVTDGRRLRQVLENLLSNALKFTEKGGVAMEVTQSGPGRVAFVVRDTGIGIAADQQRAIFEAFHQADGSTQRRYGGTGLGLTISRDLAALLGGSISVRSELGSGSAFTLEIPVEWTESARAKAAREEAAPRVGSTPLIRPLEGEPEPIRIEDDRDRIGTSRKAVLVVEDDEAFARILRDLAREMGFACVIAHTAKDAILGARLWRPAAILLDIDLPDHADLGVLDQLKHDPATRHIPVHMVSVHDYSREALELGAIGYVLKPVKRDELARVFQRLDEHLERRVRRVAVVEDDPADSRYLGELLSVGGVEVDRFEAAKDALVALGERTYDCVVLDLNLPDFSGFELLERMATREEVSFPPVVVYTAKELTADEERRLRRHVRAIVPKDPRAPERLLDEVTLFLHQVETALPPDRRELLRRARERDAAFVDKRVLLVEDDVRNVFALTRVLEEKGAKVAIARNGVEALAALETAQASPETAIDLVLMDIMMPEMDGLTATRAIRARPEWADLPVIALTAKAMRDDRDQCLAAGANDYIAKPLDVDRLLSLMRVWMRR